MRLIPQPEKVEKYYGFSLKKEINEKILKESLGEEAYELIITPDKITAYAGTEIGFYYAEVTLRQIKKLYTSIPCMKISDSPAFAYRGFMIDCARHMFSVSELKKMIDTAADVKFNKFHWHLSDDQGFRIELNALPELTRKGSVRKCDTFRNCPSDKEYGGYYTKEEISEIVAYCKEKYIDVIPELDMPGHLSAFLHVYPQYTCSGNPVEIKTKQGIFRDILCAGNDEAFSAICKILDEMCELFPYEIFHIGGDEVPKHNWNCCEKCQKLMLDNGFDNMNELQSMFMNKAAAYLREKGKKCIVWNDCLKGKNLSDDLIIQYWNGKRDKTVNVAEKGQQIILSPFMPYYVDYPYEMYTLKDVYGFMPEQFGGLSENGKKSILGVESPVWTEFIVDFNRLTYMCFPRWFAVAETGWSVPSQKNYDEFEKTVKKLCKIYINSGIIPCPESDWNPSIFRRVQKTVSFFV